MVPAFQKKYNIDKMNTVFLTDGASDGGERIISVNDNDKTEGDSWMTRRDRWQTGNSKYYLQCKHSVD